MTDPNEPDTDEELGSLTVEDDPEGTVDPAELAGGDSGDDDPLHPDHSEHDLPGNDLPENDLPENDLPENDLED